MNPSPLILSPTSIIIILSFPHNYEPTVARPEPRGAGPLLREGSGGASEAHADVPALERQGQLQVRGGQEEAGGRAEGQAEEGEDHRSGLRS